MPECRKVALSFSNGELFAHMPRLNKLCSEVILDLIFGNNADMINKVGVEKH